jgi:hypothetical protein
MERYIGIDVHAASCTLAVISEKGRKLKDFPVETNGQVLVEAVRLIPGKRSTNPCFVSRYRGHPLPSHLKEDEDVETQRSAAVAGQPQVAVGYQGV